MSIQFARRWSRASVPVIDGALSPRRRVAVRDRRRLSELLHQQLWCWGRDVVPGPAGPPVNLLVRYGLERHPPAGGGPGSNRYTSRPIGGGSRIHLWASACAWGTARGACSSTATTAGRGCPRGLDGCNSNRAAGRRAPISAPEDAGRPGPGGPPARPFPAVGGRYEAWVGRTLGDGYRDRTLARWEHPGRCRPGHAGGLARAGQRLRRRGRGAGRPGWPVRRHGRAAAGPHLCSAGEHPCPVAADAGRP